MAIRWTSIKLLNTMFQENIDCLRKRSQYKLLEGNMKVLTMVIYV